MVWAISGKEGDEMAWIVLIAGVVLIMTAIGVLIYTRVALVAFTKKLSATLDRMIAGEEEIAFEEEEETLLGKIQVRMRTLYEIIGQQARANAAERETLERTIADLSHQVKTPMAVVRMYHDLLKRSEISGEQREEFLDALEHQVDKLDFLISGMIKLSRLESGIIQVRPEQANVHHLIEEAVCGIALKADARQIDIVADCNPTLSACFDKKWTGEALANLLDNAVKYTAPGGNIRLSAQVTDFFVRIAVEDTGRGIPEEHLTDIFKRFYREEDNRNKEGVGIGLYLTREIVTRQGGFIEVRSTPGKGSTFYMNLPLEPAA